MSLLTKQQVEQWIEQLDELNTNYIKLGARYVGTNDEIWQQSRSDSIKLAKIIGHLIYINKTLENKNELVH